MTKDLNTRLAELPKKPGVYFMKDVDNKVIYIGKAKNLKSRVSSYFNSTVGSRNHRAALLILPYVDDIEWVETESEKEAFLLEANLIQKNQPRYNVRLKDDKHYPYICLNLKEKFPRVKIVRKTRNDKNLYFGPYTNVKFMRKVVNLIPKLFKIRDCSLRFPLKEPIKPCLTYHINKCDAPCADLCTEEEYSKYVDQVKNLLEGNVGQLRKMYADKMQEASKAMLFEKAAIYRDYEQALSTLGSKQYLDLSDSEKNFDAVIIMARENFAVIIINEYRNGALLDWKTLELSCLMEQDESDIVQEFLCGYYKHHAPDEILFNKKIDNVEFLEEYLKGIRNKKVKITFPEKGKKKKVLRLAESNAERILVEREIKEKTKLGNQQVLEELMLQLGLAKRPNHIVGFDISHLGGTNTVASQVDFKDAQPDKGAYRKYNIKTVDGINDFASMYEVIDRFCRNISEGKLQEPDLIMVDGGKGQVSSAYDALCENSMEYIPLIGIAKRIEEIFYPNESEPVILPYESQTLQLLQFVRNESHRFAITFQRQKRKDVFERSWVQNIEGIGKMTQDKILSKYATLKELKKASIEDVESLIGRSKAKMLLESLS